MQKPVLMGILNTSPESFFDGETDKTLSSCFKSAQDMFANGAKIIDVGGQSTKPNFIEISEEEEIKRTLPIIKLLKQNLKVEISIDSYKPAVVEASLENGANIINDVSGLKNPLLAKLAAKYKAKIVLMHNGPVKSLEEVKNFFEGKIKEAISLGVKRENIILDIGLGFDKSAENNWFLLENLNYFSPFNLPILVGASRKRFTGKTLDKSLKAAQLALKTNAKIILRVHDVKETAEFFNL